jgi:hypothetical protein
MLCQYRKSCIWGLDDVLVVGILEVLGLILSECELCCGSLS